jgi:hypothetical protein
VTPPPGASAGARSATRMPAAAKGPASYLRVRRAPRQAEAAARAVKGTTLGGRGWASAFRVRAVAGRLARRFEMQGGAAGGGAAAVAGAFGGPSCPTGTACPSRTSRRRGLQRGAEAGPEQAPAARAVVCPLAAGREVGDRGRACGRVRACARAHVSGRAGEQALAPKGVAERGSRDAATRYAANTNLVLHQLQSTFDWQWFGWLIGCAVAQTAPKFAWHQKRLMTISMN